MPTAAPSGFDNHQKKKSAMKRCPNCNTRFSDAEKICGKCAAKLEPVQDRPDAKARKPGIDLRKKDITSGAKSGDTSSPAAPPNPSSATRDHSDRSALEAAQASYRAGAYSECVRQLEEAMASGVPGAKRLYGCFLDDSKDFREAAERLHYSDGTTSSSAPSSVQTAQASAKTGGSDSTPASTSADSERLFKEGLVALERGQFDSAFQSFRRAAEGNHAMAQFYLGECYSDGKGVTRDPEKAAKWYRQAVTQFESPGVGQDDAEALLCLGGCYENGKGVKRNSEKGVRFFIRAVRQYRRAAEQGDADAMYRLGSFCENGVGIEKNEVDAVKWYLKAMQQYRGAAEQGDAEAQFMLGRCYDEGKGVDENKEEAVKWFQMAAEQGHDGAQLKLGDCFYYGCGVKKDKEEAVGWYRKAAEQGNAFAEKRLTSIARKKRLLTAFWILLLLILLSIAGSIWGYWASDYYSPESIYDRGVDFF